MAGTAGAAEWSGAPVDVRESAVQESAVRAAAAPVAEGLAADVRVADTQAATVTAREQLETGATSALSALGSFPSGRRIP
jgi:hypothetical protein